jgi:hypothetical protein
MPIGLSVIAAGSRRCRLVPARSVIIVSVFLSTAITGSEGSRPQEGTAAESVQRTDGDEQSRAANAQSYLDEPLEKLTRNIHELKGIRPATDQQALAMILRKSGERVDKFFANIIDLIAREEITQERQISGNLSSGMPGGMSQARERVRDNYLILRHSEGTQALINEFRMDTGGNRIDELGLNKGFIVTSGFALSSVHFSTAFQWDSRFLYLGDQKIEGRDTYVIAFAQLPGESRNTITMKGRNGITVKMLTQGIAWVDKGNFHVIQMRTDLLARQPEIGLDQQTTEVNFGEVRFDDVAAPLWLPRDVVVHVKFGESGDRHFEETFRNVHHYTNYRRYRVSTHMVPPQ